jgi:NLI interacting factor-like phosphatase
MKRIQQTRKNRIRSVRKKGGGITASKIAKKPNSNKLQLPPTTGKIIILFDMDDTLLCRREIYGQYNLHNKRVKAGLVDKNHDWKATIEDVTPRPDFFFGDNYGARFIYLRPNVKEALQYAKENSDAIYVFSASSDAKYILKQTGLGDYFDGVFGREFTTPYKTRGEFVLRKNLDTIRKHLNLKDSDKLYILDDHPEWVDSSKPTDHIISVEPFNPAYKLYGVQVIKYPEQMDPTDELYNDMELLNILKKIFSK